MAELRILIRPCQGPRIFSAALRTSCRPASNLRSHTAPAHALRRPQRAVHSHFATSRSFHAAPALHARKGVPSEPPPTDFNELDVLGNTPAPATSVDVCMYDGFGFNSGLTIDDGNGALIFGGEAFAWRPWEVKGTLELTNKKGQFELPDEAFNMFDMLWPRPDLLVIGVGKNNMPLSPQTRQRIADLGIRVEVLDTRNAAAQFNLLATERGVGEVAAALIPLGWRDGIGVDA